MLGTAPAISVVVPCRDEHQRIAACLNSIMAQKAPQGGLEVLVVDGMSEDGTREIVRRLATADSRLRIVDNPKRTAPNAMNAGIREARGKYVAICGAHAEYDDDYLAVCLRELLAHQAGGCSGRVITQPASSSAQARLVAWILGNPFGSSRNSTRTQPEGFTENPPYPVYLKQALLDAGGYDPNLKRNQDNDLNQRVRAKGYKLYLTWKTKSRYFPRDTILKLLRHGFDNGYWNVASLKDNPASMALRYFVPCTFVLALLASLVVGLCSTLSSARISLGLWLPFCAILGLHLVAGTKAAVGTAWQEREFLPLVLPPVFLLFHVAYGLGSVWGFLAHASKRKLEKTHQQT